MFSSIEYQVFVKKSNLDFTGSKPTYLCQKHDQVKAKIAKNVHAKKTSIFAEVGKKLENKCDW